MESRKNWVLIILICSIVGAATWLVSPSGKASASGPSAAQDTRGAGTPRITLHASALSDQIRFNDAADLQESSSARARVVAEIAVDLNLDGALYLVSLRNTDS